MPYPLHTLETAPKEVRSDLEAAQRTFALSPIYTSAWRSHLGPSRYT